MKANHYMYKFIAILIVVVNYSKSDRLNKTQKKVGTNKRLTHQESLSISNNVSKILNKLLYGYDKRLRPNYAGPPVQVGITININNINTVSEVDMDYSMDIFFRQYWTDKRLSFEGISELVIGADILKQIWVPDTFIANDKKVYFHAATVQNKFIRIYPDGQIVYSMRFTVTSACPMNFKYFPMDHQICSFEIESYGFRMDDIKYKWGTNTNSSRKALDVSPNIELPQFVYKDSKLIEREFHLSTGVYSRLTLKLFFVRSLGHYVIQIYIPSALIVILSWVSFWIDRTSAPARVSLGITTVLTMLTLIWSTNAALPKISYIKGIDVYIVFCFIMTFFSVIEYGAVSYLHRYNERKKKKHVSSTSSQQQSTTNGYINATSRTPRPRVDSPVLNTNTNRLLSATPTSITSDHGLEIVPNQLQNHLPDSQTVIHLNTSNSRLSSNSNSSHTNNPKRNKSSSLKLVRNFNHSDHRLNTTQFVIQQTENGVQAVTRITNENSSNLNDICATKPTFKVRIKASTIDNSSRVLFPVVFIIFNLIYWIYYILIVYSIRDFD